MPVPNLVCEFARAVAQSDSTTAVDTIGCQRVLFDIPPSVAYFNCAYLSPLLLTSSSESTCGIERKLHPWQIRPGDFFNETERVRALAAQLINARNDDIALTPAASYGIATAAANLTVSPQQEIIVLEDQYPSNYYSWVELAGNSGARLRCIPRPANGDWTTAILNAITPATAIAALPHCHWTDGTLIDLAQISGALRSTGAALVIDATQSLGVLPFDVAEIDPDFLVSSGYKWLLGPYSTGLLYVAPRQQHGRPLEHNGLNRAGSEDFSQLVRYRDDFQVGARRFDVGERANFALLPALIAALEQLLEWDVHAIQRSLSQLTNDIYKRVTPLGFETPKRALCAGHFLGIRHPNGLPKDATKQLAMDAVYVSVRGDSLRVTPHLYNNTDDIDRLIQSLSRLAPRP